VVPLFCANLIKGHQPHDTGADPGGANDEHSGGRGWGQRFNASFNNGFNAMLDRFEALLAPCLRRPLVTVLVITGTFIVSLLLYPTIGKSYFPRTDPSQFVINVKAPSGTRLELTDQLVAQVEQIVKEEVPESDLKIVVSNIGITPGFSSILTPNSAPHTAFVQVGLNSGHKLSSFAYMDLVRARLKRDLPQVTAYFQTGGLVDAILNQGVPAPMDIQVSGMDMDSDHAIAAQIAKEASALPGVSDVLVPQDVDYPSLKVDIDRERASELGLSAKELVDSLITALTSNGMIAPSYWIDPKTGNNYLLTVQYPENLVKNIASLGAMPLRAANLKVPTRLDSVVHISHILTPTEVDHYQIRRTVDVYVSPSGEDLSRVYAEVQRIVDQTHLPENTTIAVRGSVQAMRSSFSSFGMGLILAIVLVYLILVAQFRSFVDPFLILLAVPPGLTGVLIMLALSGTTLNIMSLMGVVMLVGIVASNSILIVEFTHRLIAEGMAVRQAVSQAARVRLRPVLMTSLATLIGLIPMALKLGEGSESYAPLARSIIGGLAVSVVFTVFIVPAAFLLVYERREQRKSGAYSPVPGAQPGGAV